MTRPKALLAAAASLALATMLATALAAGPLAAQSPSPGPLCVVTLQELSDLTGLRFVSMASGDANCTYDGDVAAGDVFTIDVRLEPTDPTIETGGEDDLWFTRFDFDAGGRDLTLGGFPAWEADEGLWVDLGEDVFVVQPLLFFTDDAPAAQTFLVPVGELVLSRLGLIDGG